MTEKSRQQDSNRWCCALGEQLRGAFHSGNLALYGRCPFPDMSVEESSFDHGSSTRELAPAGLEARRLIPLVVEHIPVSSGKVPPLMTRQLGNSAAFAAAGRILSRPLMRPVTRTFSNLHAAVYRLTRGSAQSRKYPTMLLTVTGRRSGKAYTVPLIYIRDGERLVIAAAYAGSDTDPSWWRNLLAHPRAVAQVNRDIFTVEAELAKADERPGTYGGALSRCIPTSPTTSSAPAERSPSSCLHRTADEPPSAMIPTAISGGVGPVDERSQLVIGLAQWHEQPGACLSKVS